MTDEQYQRIIQLRPGSTSRNRMTRRYGILALPAVALLLAAFVYPISTLLIRSVSVPHWGLQNFAVMWNRPIYLQVLLNTATISGLVTFCCAFLGYPLAYTMATGSAAVRRALVMTVLVPFWTSILVRTFAWLVLLQREGLINQMLLAIGMTDQPLALVHNRIGTMVGMIQILLPFMVFPLYSVMLRIDPAYVQAASGLGAGPIRAFWRVYLPLSMPGLLAGSTLVFIIALGYFITPAMLGGPHDMMIAQLIEQQISSFGNWGFAAALAVTLLAGTAVTLSVAHRVFKVRDLWSAT
jgi:putative spermidine/putrescine transport system permease protein